MLVFMFLKFGHYKDTEYQLFFINLMINIYAFNGRNILLPFAQGWFLQKLPSFCKDNSIEKR